jgi:uncharacterized protein
MRALNRSTGKELAGTLAVAESLLARTRGLLGREALPKGEGLLIRPCKGVHTFLMKFPIDVVFLDKENRVIKTVQKLLPYRISSVVISSACVIELPAGTLLESGTGAGNEIVIT